MRGKLTPRQQRFVEEYLIDLNATAAAKRAGYARRWADTFGPSLLRISTVLDAIEAAKAARAVRTQVTADRVLRELARVAFSDVRRLYGDDGQLLPLRSLDDDTAASVLRVETLEEFSSQGRDSPRELVGYTQKVWLHSKLDALDKLCRHLGIYKDQQPPVSNVNDRRTLSAAVILAAQQLLGEAGVGVPADGGPEPLDS